MRRFSLLSQTVTAGVGVSIEGVFGWWGWRGRSRVFVWLIFLVINWLTKPFFNQQLTKVLAWLIG
jgi:hypothetical protein